MDQLPRRNPLYMGRRILLDSWNDSDGKPLAFFDVDVGRWILIVKSMVLTVIVVWENPGMLLAVLSNTKERNAAMDHAIMSDYIPGFFQS